MFSKSKKKEAALQLANAIDERNKKTTRRRLKSRSKLRIRVEKNGDFGIGP